MNVNVTISKQALLTLIEAAECAVEESRLSSESLREEGEHDGADTEEERSERWEAALQLAHLAVQE